MADRDKFEKWLKVLWTLPQLLPPPPSSSLPSPRLGIRDIRAQINISRLACYKCFASVVQNFSPVSMGECESVRVCVRVFMDVCVGHLRPAPVPHI